MTFPFDKHARPAEERFVLVVGTFESEDDAQAAAASVNAALEEAAEAADELIARQGGVADAVDIDRIYARFGMRNDVGWRQEEPVFAEEEDLFWQLAAGARIEDAEQLLLSHGATEVMTSARGDEAWQAAPHPLAVPFVDDDSGEVFYDLIDVDEGASRDRGPSRKRTIH